MSLTASSYRFTPLLQPAPWPAQLRHTLMHCTNRQLYTSANAQYRQRLAASSTAAGAASTAGRMMTCRRCKQLFAAEDNTADSCQFHPALYSGGEVAKAIGFVRVSDAPEHQLEKVVGRKGLMRFWDCCGVEDETAPGCCAGFHLSFDDKLNEDRRW